MQLTRWKLIAGGAALIGATAGGIAAANDDGFDLNDRRGSIELNDQGGTGPNLDLRFDDSPESADSPNESVEESADSPNESVEESADSPSDSPDDAGFVDQSPESADSPNESAGDSPVSAPAPANDSPGSPDSPDSAGSD